MQRSRPPLTDSCQRQSQGQGPGLPGEAEKHPWKQRNSVQNSRRHQQRELSQKARQEVTTTLESGEPRWQSRYLPPPGTTLKLHLNYRASNLENHLKSRLQRSHIETGNILNVNGGKKKLTLRAEAMEALNPIRVVSFLLFQLTAGSW